MRQKPYNFSHKKAFSLFEMMLFLAISGILLTQALPKLNFGQTPCLEQLKSKLLQANDAFLTLYSQKMMQFNAPFLIAPVLENLTQKINKHCFFEYKKSKLFAHIGSKTLSFEISPKDFQSKPKIYCSLSNALCRKFWQRTLKK